jgi:hypothetical protein
MWKCFEEFEFRLVVGASLPHWLVFVSEQVGGLSRLSAGWGKCCVCCNERGYEYLELCRHLSVCLSVWLNFDFERVVERRSS